MVLSAWLRISPKPKSSSPRGRRLMLESLEDRWLPALLTVTSVSDSALGSSTYGQDVTFTASVTSGGLGVPEGSVTFSTNGVALLAPVPVNSLGQASFSTKLLFAGMHTITATYTDSGPNFTSSSGDDLLTVNPAPLQITENNVSI